MTYNAHELSPDGDGITHINVYSKARTWLGQQLTNFAHTPFNHPTLGRFASVEGFWYWLTRDDDQLRHLYGSQAKRYGKSLPLTRNFDPEAFQSAVRAALDAKLDQHPAIMEALSQSTLPLEHYYVMNFGSKIKITEPRGNEWVVAHLEQVRFAHNPLADMSTTRRMESQLEKKNQLSRTESSQLGLF